jgi:hypothetical protein
VTTVTLIGKPGCHLCEDARAVVDGVLADFPAVRMLEQSILDDAALNERYWDEIPVVLIDGAVHTIYRVDAERLRAALAAATTAGPETAGTETAQGGR